MGTLLAIFRSSKSVNQFLPWLEAKGYLFLIGLSAKVFLTLLLRGRKAPICVVEKGFGLSASSGRHSDRVALLKGKVNASPSGRNVKVFNWIFLPLLSHRDQWRKKCSNMVDASDVLEECRLIVSPACSKL